MPTKAVSEYMDYATVHGVGRVKNSPFIILKVFWVLCLCTSLGMIIFQFILLWQKFKRTIADDKGCRRKQIPSMQRAKDIFSDPVSTTIELKSSKQLEFPVVTICNTNPVNYLLFDGNIFDEIVKNASDKYNLDMSNLLTMNESLLEGFYDNFKSNETLDDDIQWATTELFRMAMNNLTNEELRNISQPMEQFILLCNYNRNPCTSHSIEEVRTYDYGICYNIYPEFQEDMDTRLVSAYGKRYGLDLLLNIDVLEGVPFVTQSSSVYVMVHSKQPGSESIILTDGAIVPAGVEANIGVSQVEKVRVPGSDAEPRCIETDKSYLECIYTCQLEDIRDVCGCTQFFIDSEVPEGLSIDEIRKGTTCAGEMDYQCIQGVLSSYINLVPDVCSGCKVPCSERYYEKSVSIGSWPAQNFMPVLHRIVKSVKNSENSESLSRKDLSGTLVMLRIYLSSLSYESVKEEYSYTLVNLLSDLGGTIGLWAGFSVLSLMEVFELLILMFTTWRHQQKIVKEEKPKETENDVREL